ncbi:MAG: sugar phosphate isomerase/epimerase family protein [Chloroflexota bacterium]
MPSAEGRANAVAAFRRLAEQAAASGITLGLEVVNRYESNLVNTAEEALAPIDEIGAPNVTVHLDSYHMNIEEDDFRTPVLVCGDRLGYVHIGENHRIPGAGHIDFGQLFGALREVGYTGAVTFESFSSAVLEPNVSNTPGHLAQPVERQRGPARRARRYIADQLGQPTRPDAAA